MYYDYYGNEDAGDCSAMGWADYSGHLGEEHADGAHEGNPHPQCHECQGE